MESNFVAIFRSESPKIGDRERDEKGGRRSLALGEVTFLSGGRSKTLRAAALFHRTSATLHLPAFYSEFRNKDRRNVLGSRSGGFHRAGSGLSDFAFSRP